MWAGTEAVLAATSHVTAKQHCKSVSTPFQGILKNMLRKAKVTDAELHFNKAQ